jgi:hypothetical protein
VILTSELEVIEVDSLSRFRSGLGILLYRIKYSRSEVPNVVQKLAKCMDGVTLAVYKEMLRVIRLILDTQWAFLKMEPKKDEEDWILLAYSDNNQTRDSENRIIITGFITYLLGTPICWSSKVQKSMTLSSSEAKYVVMSEAVNGVRFV